MGLIPSISWWKALSANQYANQYAWPSCLFWDGVGSKIELKSNDTDAHRGTSYTLKSARTLGERSQLITSAKSLFGSQIQFPLWYLVMVAGFYSLTKCGWDIQVRGTDFVSSQSDIRTRRLSLGPTSCIFQCLGLTATGWILSALPLLLRRWHPSPSALRRLSIAQWKVLRMPMLPCYSEYIINLWLSLAFRLFINLFPRF